MILSLVEISLLTVLGFFVFYLVLLSALALTVQRKSRFPASRDRLFAVIVPAHNEEPTIGKTLESLLAVDYRSDLYDVIVIADNCSDRTAQTARTAGAIVYERKDPSLKGKGYALRWCFDKLLNSRKNYDAVVVVDADSEVSGNLLRVLNHYLEDGADVIQIADVVASKPGVWSSEVTRLAFMLYNVVRPLGRKVVGWSAGLRGNGMCFSLETLRKVPWQAYSLTEDLEYGLRLLLKGITVTFAPEASVFAAMPHEVQHSESQRARWETGRFPVVRNYANQLLVASLRERSLPLLDALVDLVMPPFVNLMFFVLAVIMVNLILWTIGMEHTLLFIWLWGGVFVLGITHVLIGLRAVNADRSLYRALLYVPRYAFWKLALYAKLFVRGKPEEWIRTVREDQIQKHVPQRSNIS